MDISVQLEAVGFQLGLATGFFGVPALFPVNYVMLVPAAIAGLYFKRAWVSTVAVLVEGVILAIIGLFTSFDPLFILGFCLSLSVYGPLAYFAAIAFREIVKPRDYDEEKDQQEDEQEDGKEPEGEDEHQKEVIERKENETQNSNPTTESNKTKESNKTTESSTKKDS